VLCFVFPRDPPHVGPAFTGEGLGQGNLRHFLEEVETPEIVSETIVFNQSPVFSLIGVSDGKISVIYQCCSVFDRSRMLFEPLALFLKDIFRYTESNMPVNASPPLVVVQMGIAVRIFLERLDLIVEKPCCFGPSVGNQCLFL
jgi:hypothetical protein